MTLRPSGSHRGQVPSPRTRSPEPRLRGALRAPLGAADHRGQVPSPRTRSPEPRLRGALRAPLGGGSTTSAPRRAVRSGAGDETHAALVGLRDLDVGDP